MKKRIFFWVLPLLLVLMNFGVLRAQGESYIIVHAVNPEGVEIASIEGMGPGCVAIYDGGTWIGHGIHSEEQCNRLIAISPGNHTISVEFNGMSLGKNINIAEGELKELVFVFNRTQIDLFPIEAVGSHHITRCDRWRIRMNSIWSGNMVNYLWWDGPGSPQPWVLCETEQGPPIIVFGLDTESLPACATVSGMGYIFFDKSSATFMASIDIEPHEEQIIVKDVSLENLLSEHPYLVESTSAFEYWFLQNLYEGTIPTSPEQRMRKFADACLKKAYSTPDDPHRSTWILYGNSSRTDQYYLIPFPANVDYHLMLDSCHYHTYYSFIEEHPDEYAPYSTENIETKETAAYNLRMSSVPYDLLGTGIQCGGGQQPPECAFSAENPVWVDEADEMVLPYDEVTLAFVFTNEDSMPAENVHVKLESKNESIFFEGKNLLYELDLGTISAHDSTEPIEVLIEVDGIVDDPDEPDNKNAIMIEIIEKKNGQISLENAIEATITSISCPGSQTIVQLSPSKSKNEGGEILAIQYPDFMTNSPEVTDPPGDKGDYYNKGGGDSDFHHADHVDVRKHALKACVLDDTAFGDNPVFHDEVYNVLYNIGIYINALLGDQDCRSHKPPPDCDARLDIDTAICGRMNDGSLRPLPGVRELDKDERHICTSQAYLFGSFARTIGVPARELNIGLAKSIRRVGPIVFDYRYGQQSAVQVYVRGDWYLFDTFLEVASLAEYVAKGSPVIKYRAWHSHDQRNHLLPNVSFSGHWFRIDTNEGYPEKNDIPLCDEWFPAGEDTQEGFIILGESPITTYLRDAQGNTTGNIDGRIFEDITYSYYLPAGSQISTNRTDSTAFWEADETIFVAGSGQPEDYSLVIRGTDDGHYNLTLAYVHEDGTIDGSTITFDIHNEETHTYDISVNTSGEILVAGVPARIDIDPDTLNLNNKGKWITVYIDLPVGHGYAVSDIDVGSILLEGLFEVQRSDVQDGVLMVKFNRQDVAAYIEVMLGIEPPADVTLMVSGELIDGTAFEGSDTITVIDKGKNKESKGMSEKSKGKKKKSKGKNKE